ncbi:hypothetical protein BGZ94_003119 [Podila epigama]|nr:hypothetical protein BGZ94_003119 [Podila epigama]
MTPFCKLPRSLSFWAAIVIGSIYIKSAAAACPVCDNVETLLKPCNTSLEILTWSGQTVYQPTDLQAPCACNQNYYGQIKECLRCESSPRANYTVKAQPDYELVCLSFGQEWKPINLPQTSTTTTTTTTTFTSTTTGSLPSDSATNGSNKVTTDGLSSGALAGIIVSVVALIVALSVAGYVYSRRRRERAKARDYKYSTAQRDSFMEVALPQYTGMIQPTLPPISKVTNLRVMNPDSDDDEAPSKPPQRLSQQQANPSFEVNRSSPGWRRGSFDDD